MAKTDNTKDLIIQLMNSRQQHDERLEERLSSMILDIQKNTDLTEKVLEQATKTNGRVSISEDKIRILEDDKLRFKTIVAVIAFCASVLGGIVTLIINLLK